MPINIILVPIIIIYGILLSKKDNRNTRKLYIIVCIAVLNFVAAMRSPEWMTGQYGIDTANYEEYYRRYLDMDWNEILLVAYLRYFGGEGDGDIGFALINRIIGLFTNSFYIYSLIVNLLFFIPFGKILYRYTTNIFQIIFAFVFFLSLLMVFFYAGARQIFAIGFDMMALMAFMNKSNMKSILLYILGITIHFSSVIFVIPLLIILFDIKPKRLKLVHLLCLLLSPIVMLYSGPLISHMGNAIGMERYAKYGEVMTLGGASTFIFLIEMTSLFCFVAIKKVDLLNNDNLRWFYVMIPIFSFFVPLVYFNGSMIRISLFFHLYIFILVPMGIECMFKLKDSKLPYSLAIGVFALYAIYSGYDYYFFWQI